MADESKIKSRLEIAHVLFMDIVDYSKLLTDEQSEALHELNQLVRNTEAAREAEAAGKLTILPTGDGMALVFTGSVEEPVECALEISHALRAQPSLPVRMGIHSGPVHHVKDANERENIAGVGINIAQRVMDCGDAGHILISKRVADDLAQQRRWQPYLHELGDVEVKHGVVVSLVNLYAETIGNPNPPTRIGKVRGTVRTLAKGARKGLSPVARAIFIIAGLLIALIFVLAIVSVIFAPAIMRTLDKRELVTLPQSSATASPSLADTIKSAVAKKITEELQADLSGKKTGEAKSSATGSAIPEKSIAVLPFENLSRDPDNAYFAEGIQDEILTRLSKITDLKVISRTSTQRYKSAPNNLREIAEQLGVAHVLEGSVQKAADEVRVNVQLINAQSDSHLWADKFDRKLTDIFAVESEIAAKIAEILQAKLTGAEQRAISSRPTQNSEAHQLYLRGRFYFNKWVAGSMPAPEFDKSRQYYQQAIELDPNYALAYAGLADFYGFAFGFGLLPPEEKWAKAQEDNAKKALQLDPTLGEAYNSLAADKLYVHRDWPGAERDFRRGLELSPNFAEMHAHYAFCLVLFGRNEEALAEMRRALDLDPLSPRFGFASARLFFFVRQYDAALDQCRKTLELDPSSGFAHELLGDAYEKKQMQKEAIAERSKALHLSGVDEDASLLERTYAKSGFDAAIHALAQKRLERFKEKTARGEYIPAVEYVTAYMRLGDKEQTFAWLAKAVEERNRLAFEIKVNPIFDPLRGDSRFESLLQKVFAPK
jgi:adenylate cyclase